MIEYKTSISSSTATTRVAILFALMGATQLSGPAQAPMADSRVASVSSNYRTEINQATFTHHTNPLTGEFTAQQSQGVEFALAEFYTKLEACQVPLGEEFSKVLFDNLSNLYES